MNGAHLPCRIMLLQQELTVVMDLSDSQDGLTKQLQQEMACNEVHFLAESIGRSNDARLDNHTPCYLSLVVSKSHRMGLPTCL